MTPTKEWPHAPIHRIDSDGIYMVTGATLRKVHLFTTAEKLSLLENDLLSLAKQYQWHLEAATGRSGPKRRQGGALQGVECSDPPTSDSTYFRTGVINHRNSTHAGADLIADSHPERRPGETADETQRTVFLRWHPRCSAHQRDGDS